MPPSARSRHPAGLQELLERLAAESGHHLRVRDAAYAAELLEAEEARAIADEPRPGERQDHPRFPGRQAGLVERGRGVALEQLAVLGPGEAVEEAVQPQRAG